MSQLKVDTITDEEGTGSPDFPNGITVNNGTIDNTVIGGSTPAAISGTTGSFTSITGTAVTQSATDTTAGRLTKVGDFGLGTSDGITLTSADDLDDITVSGFYNWRNDNRPDNTPASGFFSMLVLGASGNDVTQIVFRVGAATTQARSFIRSFGASAWQQWLVNYTGQNILGTVSESSGMPTGAIIERGSNANGEFVRYADGTQICWRTFTIDSDRSFDNIFRTDTYPVWTFPAPFAERPVVSGSRDGAATGVWASARRVTSTNCEPELLSSRSRSNQIIDFCAVGRWF